MASPLPRGPRRLAAGRRQSANTTGHVSSARRPSFFSGGWTCSPGVAVGARKADSPFLPSDGSVTAKTTASFARRAFEMNCFVPSSTQPPPLSVARVRRLFASLPACGSVRQKQAMARPLASSGSHCLLLRLAPPGLDEAAAQAVLHAHQRGGRGAAGGDFLDRQDVGHVVGARAAPLGGHGHAEEAQLAQLRDDRVGNPAFLLPAAGVRARARRARNRAPCRGSSAARR